MICLHTHNVTLPNHVVCCSECGLALTRCFIPSEMKAYSDYKLEHIRHPYTRYKRFTNLIHSIVYGFESPSDRKMLDLLDLNSNTIFAVEDIISQQASSNLVDKRYCSLLLFIKCFLPQVSTPSPIAFEGCKARVLSTFKQIEFKLAQRGSSFVNYRFTLDALLYFFGLDKYRVFIKPLKCKKRVRNNVSILNSLQIKVTDGRAFLIPDTFVMSPRSLFRHPEDRV